MPGSYNTERKNMMSERGSIMERHSMMSTGNRKRRMTHIVTDIRRRAKWKSKTRLLRFSYMRIANLSARSGWPQYSSV